MKVIGKPYVGKPHVRFDEGATEHLHFAMLRTLLYRETYVMPISHQVRKEKKTQKTQRKCQVLFPQYEKRRILSINISFIRN